MSLLTDLALLVLASVGSLTLLYLTYSTIRFLNLHLHMPSHPLQAYKRSTSTSSAASYALITGSSAGIGLGIAQALIQRGFNIVLLGHSSDELSSARASLQLLNLAADVRILVMDARTASPAEMADAVGTLSELPVSILVNNVGGNPIKLPAFRDHATYGCEDVDAVINQNARFMARLTALMLPLLSRRGEGVVDEKGMSARSLILNVSSSAHVGVPWLVMYSATKGFVLSFSRALARELAAAQETQHVDCIAIVPGEVRSQGNSEGVAESEPKWDVFGEMVVRKVDGVVKAGGRELSPWMMHDVKDRLLASLPESIRTRGVTDALAHKKNAFNAVYEKSR